MLNNSQRVEQVRLGGNRSFKVFIVAVIGLLSTVAVLISLMMWLEAKDNLKAENGSLTIAQKSLKEMAGVQVDHEKARQLVRQYIFEFNATNVDAVGKLLCSEVPADVRASEMERANGKSKLYHRTAGIEDTGDKNIFSVVTNWWNNSNVTGDLRWKVNLEKNCISF